MGAGRAGNVGGGTRDPAFPQRVGKARRERPRQSRQLLAVIGVRCFEPEREIVGVSECAGRGIRTTEIRRGSVRSRRPAARRDRDGRASVAGSNSGCGPVPKKSDRTKIGGARSNARGQGRGSKRARLPTTKPRPTGASTSIASRACPPNGTRSVAASGSKPARQCATTRYADGPGSRTRDRWRVARAVRCPELRPSRARSRCASSAAPAPVGHGRSHGASAARRQA